MIICLIQTRLTNSRLPGKVLKEIDGKPIQDYVIEGCQRSKMIDMTGIIFPNNPQNRIFYDLYFNKCLCFAGSEENVLERYYKAVKYVERESKELVKHIVRITADCPLIYFVPHLLDFIITKHVNERNDFTRNRGQKSWPSGFDIEVFTKDALFESYNNAKTKEEKEHMNMYIKNNMHKFKIGEIDGGYDYNYWWSVDTVESFNRVADVFKILKLLKADEFYYNKEAIDNENEPG